MAAETQYTVQQGMQQVSVANTNLDGTTGTYSNTIITGASSGTLLVRATMKSIATCSEGMIRFFVTGGGTTKMIHEEHVRATKPSADQPAFERTIDLNFPLQSGYTLKCSTAIGETFNIIVQGLDWTYFGTAVRPDSQQFVANTGINSVSTANTNLDGTGTIATILTAGASATYKGCLIENVTITATAFATGSTTTPGMVRLFIYDGSSVTRLLTEVVIPESTQSSTQPTFSRRIPLNFYLQAGWSLRASTEKGDTFAIAAEGKDWKYPATSQITNFTPATAGAVTTEELLHSLQVPANFLAANGLFEVYCSALFTASTNNKTYRISVNTTNSLSGATVIATAVAASASVSATGFARTFPIISDTALECMAGAATTLTNEYGNSAGTSANVTVPSVSAGFWVLISAQKATAGETATARWSMVNKII